MLNEQEIEVLKTGGKRKGLEVFYDKTVNRVIIEKDERVIFEGSELEGAIFLINYKN